MAEGCFHCGEPLPADPPVVTVDGVARAVCCPGCAAATEFIGASGLADYYRIRAAMPARAEADGDYAAWDRPDLLAEHSLGVDGGREITVLTDGMRCAACAWLIDRALRRVAGVLDVQANAVTGRIRLQWDPRRQPLSALLRRLAGLGYRPALVPDASSEAARLAAHRLLILRLGVAGLASLQAMMFTEALYLDFDRQMPEATRDFFRWVAFAVSSPVVFFSGWPFLAGLARELAARHPGMDSLIGGSVLLAYGGSLVETVRGGPHVWFDAAVMFVFLLLAARALEQFARRRANAAVEQLARARPANAKRLRGDGVVEVVPLAALAAGDVVQVAPGEAVPADGVLLDAGEFDQALLSGESRPVVACAGAEALAGSLALSAPVRLRITRTGAATRLAELVRLVEAAQQARPRLAAVADAVSSRFVLALMLIAAGVYAWWWQVEPTRAFEVTLAVLVISCPCALSLAIPAGLAVAHGALARLGVLALRPDAIDTLARIDRVVLDKTGTLTEGRPRVAAVQAFDGMSNAQALAIAAALERDSGHPLARAFEEPMLEPLSPRASEPLSLRGEDRRLRPAGGRSRRAERPRATREGRGVGGGEGSSSAREFNVPGHVQSQSNNARHPELVECESSRSFRTLTPTPLPKGEGLSAQASMALQANDRRISVGQGVEGRVAGHRYLIGRAEYAAAREDDAALWLGDGARALARFEIEDPLRADAAAAVQALGRLGIAVEIASGDGEATVADVARRLGIDTYGARQLPEAKLERVRALQLEGHVVAMLGDGINDAPVLAGADVSIALAAGAPLAHRAADLVLLGSELTRLPQAVTLARRTRRVLRQNLGWALAYNLLALPFAAAGLITPWLAALGMAGSSLLVTLNALRLGRTPASPARSADATIVTVPLPRPLAEGR